MVCELLIISVLHGMTSGTTLAIAWVQASHLTCLNQVVLYHLLMEPIILVLCYQNKTNSGAKNNTDLMMAEKSRESGSR